MRKQPSRRQWLQSGGAMSAGLLAAQGPAVSSQAMAPPWPPLAADTNAVSLCGEWRFLLDPGDAGLRESYPTMMEPGGAWRAVTVPHTWQVEPENAEHYGTAWYSRAFDVPRAWQEACVRVEFEAVFHSAWVWINGRECGSHVGKGYTGFAFDVSQFLRFGEQNRITVRVDNRFHDAMLPRGRSSDWAHDGGIYRPVSLLISPRTYIERVAIDAVPDLDNGTATVAVAVTVVNAGREAAAGELVCRVVDEASGLAVREWKHPEQVRLDPLSTGTVTMPTASLESPRLWHFDNPHLYRLEAELRQDGRVAHRHQDIFGVRTFEARDGGFFLNGQRVRPMGVERMAGSHPRYGMAEPIEWLHHDHQDMLELNCVFTRVHWPQDRRTLDFCDRHGILMQPEVPTWGSRTFADMEGEPSAVLMENGLGQLREMIARDRNHPCIYAWGLCNEIGGQHPAAYRFAERMYQEAKALDPRRLRTYASHSLYKNPGADVSRLMDFVSFNEYYESWMGGTPAGLRQNVEEIRAAFPGKPIVISEYGYCACTADRPEGDARRIQVLHEHTAIFRDFPEVAGLIFFCYNDYRTHVGDRGLGVLKQRVHGVVDVLGNRKPSFAALREESSPIEHLEAKGTPAKLQVTLRTRADLPSWPLEGYRLRWTAYGYGNFPAEEKQVGLPRLEPGGRFEAQIACETREPTRVVLEVLRPSGMATSRVEWLP